MISASVARAQVEDAAPLRAAQHRVKPRRRCGWCLFAAGEERRIGPGAAQRADRPATTPPRACADVRWRDRSEVSRCIDRARRARASFADKVSRTACAVTSTISMLPGLEARIDRADCFQLCGCDRRPAPARAAHNVAANEQRSPCHTCCAKRPDLSHSPPCMHVPDAFLCALPNPNAPGRTISRVYAADFYFQFYFAEPRP